MKVDESVYVETVKCSICGKEFLEIEGYLVTLTYPKFKNIWFCEKHKDKYESYTANGFVEIK